MKVEKINSLELYQEAFTIQELGNKAIKDVLKENETTNIPSVFSKNGVIYYKLPSGEVTQESPFS